MNESYGFGFLQPVAELIIKIVDALYQVTVAVGFPSYALAIIMISILLKLILYPLMQKQMKSTMNMQEVQPKLEYVQKKYKNNPEKIPSIKKFKNHEKYSIFSHHFSRAIVFNCKKCVLKEFYLLQDAVFVDVVVFQSYRFISCT